MRFKPELNAKRKCSKRKCQISKIYILIFPYLVLYFFILPFRLLPSFLFLFFPSFITFILPLPSRPVALTSLPSIRFLFFSILPPLSSSSFPLIPSHSLFSHSPVTIYLSTFFSSSPLHFLCSFSLTFSPFPHLLFSFPSLSFPSIVHTILPCICLSSSPSRSPSLYTSPSPSLPFSPLSQAFPSSLSHCPITIHPYAFPFSLLFYIPLLSSPYLIPLPSFPLSSTYALPPPLHSHSSPPLA